MVDVIFGVAKNGEATCTANGTKLHSLYNPSREAASFVEKTKCDFLPAAVIVIEPAVSYCASFLHKRFLHAKIMAIRHTHSFDDYNNCFDKIFYYTGTEDIETTLLQQVGEATLCCSLFLQWPPSATAFSSLNLSLWQAIKSATQKAKTLLVTKSFFQKRWILNTVLNCTAIQKVATIRHIDMPIVMAASGPSLAPVLPSLKENRDKFFLVALSSSISSLLYNGITPDMAITTDGGYWAKLHLYPLQKNLAIPLAYPNVAAIPSIILRGGLTIPLVYNDEVAGAIFSKWADSTRAILLNAVANGTVAGTAILLLHSLSSGDIFMCGEDLAQNKDGYCHVEPNEIDLATFAKYTRLNTAFTQQAKELASSYSLKVYRDWFSSLDGDITKRLFRVIDSASPLGSIKDIAPAEFDKILLSLPPVHSSKAIAATTTIQQKSCDDAKRAILNFIDKIEGTEEWRRAIFPLEYTQCDRLLDDETRQLRLATIKDKSAAFTQEVRQAILHQ